MKQLAQTTHHATQAAHALAVDANGPAYALMGPRDQGSPGSHGGFDVVDWLIGLLPSPEHVGNPAPFQAPSDSSEVVMILLLMIMVLGGLVLGWIYFRDFKFIRNPFKVFRANGPFQPKPILTPNEIEFYNRMVSALPGYVVLSQVAMSAFIEPRTDDPKEYMRRRMKFAQKFVDFIVCEPGDLRIICVVELDDITHDEAKDALRDEMLGSAGYTVVRWHSRKKPDRAAIAKAIRKLDNK